jgi:predicted HTH transcriptional regulator
MKLIEYIQTDRPGDYLKNKQAILEALQAGCRTPYEVAEMLNQPIDMIERRMQRLKRKGILEIVHYWRACGEESPRVQNE